jgi:integrase
MLTAPTDLTTIDKANTVPKGARELRAPPDLKIPFWPARQGALQPLEAYSSTEYWFMGMRKATKKAYKTHLRLFCKFYSTDPDILVMFPAEHLKILLDAYLAHLIRIAVPRAGKPKPGQVSVNSIAHYFTGLHEFFVNEHEKNISWNRYEKKFPEKVNSNLRGYYRDEVQKLYKAADIYDKPLVLLEYCAFIRVGAIGLARFEHLLPIQELAGFYFLKVYPDSADDFYYVVLTPEFMGDIENLKQYRERWGEKITGRSYLLCQKDRRMWGNPLGEDTIRGRMRRLARKAGVDLSNIQPNHGLRKAGNTAMKNAHVDRDFKELLMGHSCGLDSVYYDVENPESRREIAMEYMKAVDSLTVSDESKLKRELEKANEKLKQVPTIEELQTDLAEVKEFAQLVKNSKFMDLIRKDS